MKSKKRPERSASGAPMALGNMTIGQSRPHGGWIKVKNSDAPAATGVLTW
jgi:hypothetical protein